MLEVVDIRLALQMIAAPVAVSVTLTTCRMGESLLAESLAM